GANSIWNAIGNLGADRIGHGVALLEDPAIMQIVIDRGIALEVCPTSNYLSGVVDTLAEHPIQALTEQGVQTTINTDDPLICNVNLSQEIYATMRALNLSLDDIKQYQIRAAQSSFLPSDERAKLVTEFENYMQALPVSSRD
ncbi:MAG: adenosine deaminase, partial [Chloroflexota bacterium]